MLFNRKIAGIKRSREKPNGYTASPISGGWPISCQTCDRVDIAGYKWPWMVSWPTYSGKRVDVLGRIPKVSL
jgi:hypothetical protein